jgi:hypothetical protein
MAKAKRKRAKEFNINQTRTVFASKFYLEQFAGLSIHYQNQGYTRDTDLSSLPEDELKMITNQAELELYRRIRKESSDYIAILVKHDRDEVTDGVWEVATAKPHYHLLFKIRDYNKRQKARTVLNRLGVQFDKERDEDLIKGGGLEVPEHFENYAKYLLHNTSQAKKDNKYMYSISDLVMNIGVGEYIEMTAYSHSKVRLSSKEVDEFVRNAIATMEKAGMSFRDWETLYDELPLDVKRSGTDVAILKKKFDFGLRKGIENYGILPKVNIYLKGIANSGKSFASLTVLRRRGRVHEITGGKTGKFDSMSPDKSCLLVDDNTVSDPLNLFDFKPAMTYRRGSGNAVCMATTNIVTSNLEFSDWLLDCGVDTDDGNFWKDDDGKYHRKVKQGHWDAMVSRFNEVHVRLSPIGNGMYYHEFYVKRYATRGSKDVLVWIRTNVDAIVNEMNEVSKQRLFDEQGNLL